MVRQSSADAEAQSLTCGATVFPPQKAEAPASETATLLQRWGTNQRACISDYLKIGYYSTDHAVQTDIKEIQLKELAVATQALIKLVHSLHQDLFIYKSIIQKEVQIRQSYEEQLCDALAVLRANIEKYYSINGDDTECSPGKLLKLLHNKVHEKESITENLERKLQEYQGKGRAISSAIIFTGNLSLLLHVILEPSYKVVFEDDDHEKKMLAKENEDFKEEVFKLHSEISRLENALKRSEKEKYLLDKQVQRMRSKMEADEQTLIDIQEQMKARLKNERPLVKNLVTYVVPEQQAAERNLTAETEKLKNKGQEKQTTERKYTGVCRKRIREEAKLSEFSEKRKKPNLIFITGETSLHAIKDEMFIRQTLRCQLLALKCTPLSETVPLKEDMGYSEGILDIFNDFSALQSLFLTTAKLCVEYSVVTNLIHASISE
ncbi:LOW QUALITY PROTEIN: uncharacterized protein C10orf67 homolog, mitochondrial [Morus bassanus]